MGASAVGGLVAERALRLPSVSESSGLHDPGAEDSTPPGVREETIDAIERHLCDHYARRPGIAPLCRAVAALLTRQGVPTGEGDVVISGSVDEARYVAVRALAAGKEVWLPEGTPPFYDAALLFAGATVRRFDPAAPLPEAQGGVLILSLPDPSAHESSAWEQRQRLAAWAVTHDLVVIADETLAPLPGSASITRTAALPGLGERTLTLGGFAGLPGLAAWQVSWFAGPKRIFTPVRDLKQTITICTAAAGQYAALAAMRHLDE